MKQFIALTFIVSLLFLTGCGSDYDDEGTLIPTEPISDLEVELVVTSVEFNGVLYPLENDIIPEPEGVDINLRTADYSEAELFTLASNEPTIGVLSNINVGRAFTEGEIYKVLTPYYREIVGPNGDTMGKVVTMLDSNIMTPKDLEGKRVGIQGEADGSSIAFMTALKKIYQVDLDTIEFIAVESNMAPLMLQEGNLDASMFDSDYIITEGFSESYKVVIDFNREMYDFYGTVPPASFFVVKKEFYDEDPALYNRIIDFFTENYQWYKDNVEEVSQLEADASGDSYETIRLKADYEERAGKVTEKDIGAFYGFYEIAKERGVIDFIPDLNELFITP